jgi:hypothetical protein
MLVIKTLTRYNVLALAMAKLPPLPLMTMYFVDHLSHTVFDTWISYLGTMYALMTNLAVSASHSHSSKRKLQQIQQKCLAGIPTLMKTYNHCSNPISDEFFL